MSNVTIRVVINNNDGEDIERTEPIVVDESRGDLIAEAVRALLLGTGCYVGDTIRIEAVRRRPPTTSSATTTERRHDHD